MPVPMLVAGRYAEARRSLRRRSMPGLLAVVGAIVVSPTMAADVPGADVLIAAQRKALKPLDVIDGIWRGEALVTRPDGSRIRLTQTERVGSMLDGSIKVIEGRGYAADGSLHFNAFAVLSFTPQSGRYGFRSYAQGYIGDFSADVRSDGFSWSIPAGPATIRYTATVKDGVWTEIGERIVEGQPPVPTFEMTLKRIGDTDWPASGAVPPQ